MEISLQTQKNCVSIPELPLTFSLMTTSEPNDLELYAEDIRRRIQDNDCEVFRNKSALHASIILREFIKSAKDTVFIFCGHLNKFVYEHLFDVFQTAIQKGVNIKVITESDTPDSVKLAQLLREKDRYRSVRQDMKIPHFVIVDGKRYRMETDEAEKTALVCACVCTEEQKKRALVMNKLFQAMWNFAEIS